MVSKFGVDTLSPSMPKFVIGKDIRASFGITGCPKLTTVSDVDEVFGPLIDLQHEVIAVGAVDSKCRLTYCSILAINPPDLRQVRPVDAFLPAINANAASIILVQRELRRNEFRANQSADLTDRFAEAGVLLGYPLMDHVIFTEDGPTSAMSVEALRLAGRRLVKVDVEGGIGRQSYTANWKCGHCKELTAQSWQDLSRATLAGRLALPTRCALCRKFVWLAITGRQASTTNRLRR